ncbi:MAG: phosphate/phosphite/phosphonate ABC transporter substrate-binding protein, partial [Gammaproteobacteria bacterium]|nr:phosphate/phosphite/phosphonate ABC transporter substrate-binding protein [Gammaproteobacteria bacterium]
MTMHNTLIIVLLICAFVLHGGVAWAAPLQQKKLIFGIIPQQSVEAIDRSWAPLLRHISENSGYQVELQTTKNIASFKARVKSEEFDIAYMNPLMYVSEESRQYQAFAKEKDAKLNGIIVVEKNSPYYSLESLNGLSLAFPDLEAFAATLVPLSFLEKKGAHVKINIVGQHDAVYRAVATGAYPAGGGVAKTLEKSDEKTKG